LGTRGFFCALRRGLVVRHQFTTGMTSRTLSLGAPSRGREIVQRTWALRTKDAGVYRKGSMLTYPSLQKKLLLREEGAKIRKLNISRDQSRSLDRQKEAVYFSFASKERRIQRGRGCPACSPWRVILKKTTVKYRVDQLDDIDSDHKKISEQSTPSKTSSGERKKKTPKTTRVKKSGNNNNLL